MTIKELIAILSQHKDDDKVFVYNGQIVIMPKDWQDIIENDPITMPPISKTIN